MKLFNRNTGDVLEVPPPDSLGQSVVRLNGRIVEHAFYGEQSITNGEGKVFPNGDEWAAYLVGRLRNGGWE